MLNKKCTLIPAALVLFGVFGVSAAKADDDAHCYTVASLKGTYAVVATYSANVALALAIRHFDGQGNLTGTFTLNAPVVGSTTGARTIITGTQVGNVLGELRWHRYVHAHPYVINWCRYDPDG